MAWWMMDDELDLTDIINLKALTDHGEPIFRTVFMHNLDSDEERINRFHAAREKALRITLQTRARFEPVR
jgi:hypothetical protein